MSDVLLYLNRSAEAYGISGQLIPLAGIVLLFFFLLYQLRVKRFYFVRHGETLLNKAMIKQGSDGKLSEAGVAQALAIGLAFKDLHIDQICSSPYERAIETATLMQKTLKKRIAVSPLLAERRSASEVIGKSVDDPEVKRIMGLTTYGFHEDSYRFSDEENFEDLVRRARKCLAYLERRSGSQVVVVTHHTILKMILAYMLYRKDLHAPDFVKLAYFNPADNGGVTVCDFNPLNAVFGKTHGWEVITYNQPIT